MASTMKAAIVGVSHWHLALFLGPLQNNGNVQIVAVSDSDPIVAAKVARDAGCIPYTDYRELIEHERPDFVMVLGPHAQMARTASYLIEAGVPFAIEKPAGLNGTEVARIADQAARAGAFAAVPFTFRQGDFVQKMLERNAGERFDHLSFTMIGRPPQQYERMGNSWMLDRRLSGGGALLNLGVHFLDLIPYLVPGEPVEVASAVLSNAAWGLPIEDYAVVTLRVGSTVATIQTGYRYTSPEKYMDLHFSLRTPSNYYVVRERDEVEVNSGGESERWQVGTMNMPYYPRFVDDVIERVAAGATPIADLGDAARAMELLDRIYAATGTPAAGDDVGGESDGR